MMSFTPQQRDITMETPVCYGVHTEALTSWSEMHLQVNSFK